MGTAVLRSHDCLENRLHHDYFGSRPPPPMKPRKKPLRSPPPSSSPPGRPSTHRPARSSPPKPHLKREPARLNGWKPTDPDKENVGGSVIRNPKSLVMEEVTILKRGEEFKPAAAGTAVDRKSYGSEETVLCSTNRLGPDPATVPKFSDLRSVYAGPAFISSPAPSCLPFPAFFLKRNSGSVAIKGDLGAKGS